MLTEMCTEYGTTSVGDVGPALYKCHTNILCLVGCAPNMAQFSTGMCVTKTVKSMLFNVIRFVSIRVMSLLQFRLLHLVILCFNFAR